MVLQTSTFISDSLKFIRDDLGSNIVDPISGSRATNERFVMTSYPKRAVNYPIVTVKSAGISDDHRLGMRNTGTWTSMLIEVRAWARNEKEKDALTEQIINRIRSNQFGTSGGSISDDFGLHDYKLMSVVSVDEDGEAAIKSSVMEFEFKTVLE